jgi:putative NIF3 family GTP cyclohydrolase 1 type 2
MLYRRMQNLIKVRYPEELADRSWDNVGLLLSNTDAEADKRKPMVMVTNDLTYQVAVDAIEKGASVIVSYREL